MPPGPCPFRTQQPTQKASESSQPCAAHDDQIAEAPDDTDERNTLTLAKDSDDTQPDATDDAHGPCWIRTSDRQIMSPVGDSTSSDEKSSCEPRQPRDSNRRSNAAQNGPELTALANALAALPESDRPAVVAHVAALAKLGPAKRAAISTLTDSNEGEHEA